jgi:hypothetical protein
MFKIKPGTKRILLIVSFCFIFFIGIFLGGFIEPILIESRINKHEKRVINYLYEEIEKEFGEITKENYNEYEIIGSIPFKGPMDIVIILESGVKTIRVDIYR